jgi:N-methylhydantoinase A
MLKTGNGLPLVGIYKGGTFTDLVMVTGARIHTYKFPSTPHDPPRAVLDGIDHLLSSAGRRISFTVRWLPPMPWLRARGLARHAGGRDLLTIGRKNRLGLYRLHPGRVASLVAREEVAEKHPMAVSRHLLMGLT